jgi:hypothetical protein
MIIGDLSSDHRYLKDAAGYIIGSVKLTADGLWAWQSCCPKDSASWSDVHYEYTEAAAEAAAKADYVARRMEK